MAATKKRKPSLVKMANAKLDDVRATLAWCFDVASLEGDKWSTATITAARRVLGSDEHQSKLTIEARKR